MGDFDSELNRWFTASTRLINTYVDKIEQNQESGSKSSTPNENKLDTLMSKLEDVLADTHMELKDLDKSRVRLIEPKSLQELNTALSDVNEALNEIDVEVESLISDSGEIPFANVLKEVQDLMNILEELKETRGKRIGSIENMEEAALEKMEDEMSLESSAFKHGGEIPIKYTKFGENISPPLDFYNQPSGAKSFVLIFEDLDTPDHEWMWGSFIHWMIWNIPATLTHLEEGKLTPHIGKNGFQKNNYEGPTPPLGVVHHYVFNLYALDEFLEIENGATRKELEKAMQGHILEEAELLGTFQRLS